MKETWLSAVFCRLQYSIRNFDLNFCLVSRGRSYNESYIPRWSGYAFFQHDDWFESLAFLPNRKT